MNRAGLLTAKIVATAIHCDAPFSCAGVLQPHPLQSRSMTSRQFPSADQAWQAAAINRNKGHSAIQKAVQAVILPALFRRHFFRFIPAWKAANAAVWNCLKSRFFLLHPAPVLNIQRANLFIEPVSIP
jgi:hypothetical protein